MWVVDKIRNKHFEVYTNALAISVTEKQYHKVRAIGTLWGKHPPLFQVQPPPLFQVQSPEKGVIILAWMPTTASPPYI